MGKCELCGKEGSGMEADHKELGRIMVCQECWIEHNKEHENDFKRWAEKAREFDKNEVYEAIMKAVEHMKVVNECLFKAFELINNKDKKDKK